MGHLFRSVSKRSRLEIRLKDRLQDQLQCPLDHTITNRRNRQDADLAPVLRYLNLRNHSGFQTCVNDRSVALSPAHQKQGSFPPPTLLSIHDCMTLSVFQASHHPIDDGEGATFTIPGYPAITQITFLACCAH